MNAPLAGHERAVRASFHGRRVSQPTLAQWSAAPPTWARPAFSAACSAARRLSPPLGSHSGGPGSPHPLTDTHKQQQQTNPRRHRRRLRRHIRVPAALLFQGVQDGGEDGGEDGGRRRGGLV